MRFAWLLLLVTTSIAFAQLSPGELSRYHAKLEGLNNCTQCHELGEDVTAAKCLTCHTAIKQRIAAGEGYHSSPEVKAERCAKCHGEHFGREFELVYWKDGKEKFDHSKTGYALVGAHAKQECKACQMPCRGISNKRISLRQHNQSQKHLSRPIFTMCVMSR